MYIYADLSCFFFNDTATTEIYTLSLHDALPICAGEARYFLKLWPDTRPGRAVAARRDVILPLTRALHERGPCQDRKSTRLNSSHANISYAVFCLKKKKNTCHTTNPKLRMVMPQ